MAPSAASIVSTLISLAVIFGALFGAALILRKFRDGTWNQPAWARSAAPPSRIKILATRPLGWQASLLIVEADGQRFLIGTGRAGLTAIGALGDTTAPTAPP